MQSTNQSNIQEQRPVESCSQCPAVCLATPAFKMHHCPMAHMNDNCNGDSAYPNRSLAFTKQVACLQC